MYDSHFENITSQINNIALLIGNILIIKNSSMNDCKVKKISSLIYSEYLNKIKIFNSTFTKL
jgi:hypothetical protein